MARRRKGRRKSRRSGGKGHVPLEILENRLKKLTRVVKSRGGYLPGDV